MENKLIKSFTKKKFLIVTCIIAVIYLFGTIYFMNHYMFNTYINGINVSCKNIDDAERNIIKSFDNYELQLNERNGIQETIYGKDIELKYICEKKELVKIQKAQRNYLWLVSFFKDNKNEINDFIEYNDDKMDGIINNLNCVSGDNIIEPQNPSFQYNEGKYIIINEIYGNKVNKELLKKKIIECVNSGNINIDLDSEGCYEYPKYTAKSEKVIKAKELLDKYISANIVYDFDEETETVDGDVINKWINVNNDLDVEFNRKNVDEYIKGLCEKYNTVGKEREFKTASGKKIIVKGGHYGWKINSEEEANSLIENIQKGQRLMKEPIYSQKAVSRKKNDIGDTYVEVSITRQHLWFYKNGKLVTQGDVVTGNINRGCATQLGIYPLNYKQKNATLKGFGYSSPVKYWMPFNGNIGIHDASWRNSFGGDIYKNNGTHGCVNAPLYLAKVIYDEIDAGIPIICYEDK